MADDDRQPEQQSPRGQEFPTDRAGILPPQHWTAHIEHAPQDPSVGAGDDDDDDGDSALGDDDADSTASLTSSILRYRTIHGRTYHSERGNAQYWYDSLDARACSFA
jgi:hypothetical protein